MDGNMTPPSSQKQHNENSINAPPESKELSVLLDQQSGEHPPAELTCNPRDPMAAHTDLEGSCGGTL